MTLTGKQLIAAQWVLVVWTFIVVVARIYIRVGVRGGIFKRKSWRWSDIFVILAWLNFTGVTAMDAVTTAWNFPDPTVKYTMHQLITIQKISYAQAAMIWLTVYFIKGSMLCFYNEWIPKILLKTWWFIRVAGFITFSFAVSTLVIWLFFGCHPVSSDWNPDAGFCWNLPGHIQFAIVAQISSDLMVLAIPFTVLPLLANLDPKQKIGAGVIFALGLCSTACTGIVAYTVLVGITGAELLATSWMAVMFEAATAITMACLPAFKAFLTRRELRNLRNGGARGAATTVEVACEEQGSNVEAKDEAETSVTKVSSEGGLGRGSNSGSNEVIP